ncbi:MAG TPA: IPT/TIG domain-containing protein [Acidimicrobiales bacterium]|nr:IPT/TIG domain-containing protein [Acidimicrobiales bacterium]
MRGGNLKDPCGYAPLSRASSAEVPGARRATRRAWRCAPLLAALAVTAAACSSAPPVGQLGSTLPAMGGAVTFVKVFSPATLARTTLAVPVPGHKMVAVILTVHSPTSAAANFAAIYTDSKLVDTNHQGHIAKREGKYQVTQCLTYPPFALVSAGQSQTGCELFLLPLAATPVELKISGKAEANFKISPAQIVAGAASAPIVTTPRLRAPLTEGLGSSSSTTSTTGAGGTAPATTTTGIGTTTTTTSPGSTGHQVHHHGQGVKPPVISHVDPRAGLVGQKVQILGKRLSGATMVTISGVPATIVKKGKNKVTVYVPLGATSGSVVVYTPSGNVTSAITFSVL